MANAHSSYLFTSESVTEGHPDKVCDPVSYTHLNQSLGCGCRRGESKREEIKKVRRMPNLENLVEPRGIEPLTSWLPAMRSPS